MVDVLLHDLRYAVRSLRRSVLFTGITVLTLGLGIGVVTALFSVIDAVLLQPIAADQDRVVRIWGHDTARGLDRVSFSYPEMRSWREGTRSFEALGAIQYADASTVAITIDGQSTPVEVTPVSMGFFEILHDGEPLYGRWFNAADEVKGADLVTVVSERFWRRVSGGDPGFVGRRLTRAGGGRTILVVGVAPAALDYPLGTDLWMPLAGFYEALSTPAFDVESWNFRQFHVIGRLSRGVSLDQAQAELTVLDRQWVAQFPGTLPTGAIVVEPLLNSVLGNSRQVLLFLFAAAGLVFVIAGVNVAALLLMRASARRREVAVRVALGASHARLTRQDVTESLLLGALGASCGLVIAQLFLGTAQWLAPDDIPRIDRAVLDFRVLVFCVSAALVWVLTFGTAPAWSRRRHEMVAGIGSSELSFRGARGTTALRVFTIAEIASAVVVAIAAGLLVRSFAQLQAIDRGYDSSDMAVVRLLLPSSRYPDARARLAFFEELVPRVASIPGVASVSPVHLAPGTGTTGLSVALIIEGQTPEEAESNPWATWEPVMPSYFQTLGIPIIRGRAFTHGDSRDAAPVVIVSEAVARHYWPGQDPIGKRLKFIARFPWTTVVGVAADTRYRELTRAWLTVYFPAPQFFFFGPGSLVVRTAWSPEALFPAIRQTIQTQERDVALESITTMDALAATELSRPRTALTVAALFALMAIVLSAVGVYGVMSYEVSQRRRELAVRSALGASPDRIFRAVVWRSVTVGAIGTLVGLMMASLATRTLRVLLFEVSPADPGTFLLGAAGLLGIVLLASYLPARRAAGVDPVVALRIE